MNDDETKVLTITELADLRSDVRGLHEELTRVKQESINIVALLDANLRRYEAAENDESGPEFYEKVEAVEETREFALAVYQRLENGDASLRDPALPAESNDEEEPTNDDN